MKRTLVFTLTLLAGVTIFTVKADAQTTNRACDTEGVTTSNSLICTRTNTKRLVWKPIATAVPDACSLFDNPGIATKAASKGITNPSQTVVRIFDEPLRRVCRLGDNGNNAWLFATRKAPFVTVDIGGSRVSLLESDAIPVTASTGKTVYTYARNGNYFFWGELTPGVIIGMKIQYIQEPDDVENARTFFIEQLALKL
jgi:hypothetical protein